MTLVETVRRGWAAPTNALVQGSLIALPFSALVTLALSALFGVPFAVEIVVIAVVQFVLSLWIAGRLVARGGHGSEP